MKIPVTTPERVVTELSAVIAGLARDPARWEALSCGAIDRARAFHWSRLGDEMAGIYGSALAGTAPRESCPDPTARPAPLPEY